MRRKKRVEDTDQIFGCDSLTVVTEIDLDFSGGGCDGGDPDFARVAVRKCMPVCIFKQVQQYLPERTRITLQRKVFRDVDNDLRAVFAYAQFKCLNDVFDHFTEVECASPIAGLVDRYFLEV